MRYATGHKEATRQKIVGIASKRFREQGVEAVGLASLMADAGLTHGGFYAHFASKEELVKAAVRQALTAALARMTIYAENSSQPMEAFVHAYLSPAHRDQPSEGCAVAALAAEIARHPSQTRVELDKEIRAYVERFDRWLGGGKEPTAIALYGLMVGTLQIARTCPDEEASNHILACGITAALTLIKDCTA
jgi:TetR/AcrR family transcriptional repressor of nem operon